MNVCYSLCLSFYLPGYLKCKKYKQRPQFCKKKKKNGEEKGRNILYKETNQYWLILATSGVRA